MSGERGIELVIFELVAGDNIMKKISQLMETTHMGIEVRLYQLRRCDSLVPVWVFLFKGDVMRKVECR